MIKLAFSILACMALLTGALPVLAQDAGPAAASVIPPMEASKPVPADLAQMVADFNAAMSTKDMDLIMAFFSERYLHDGYDKKKYRPYLKRWNDPVRGYELQLTSFRPVSADRAYITAIMRMSGVTMGAKDSDYQMVREDGQWKWLGNQRKE